jgi:hypothetical protein
LTIEEHEEEWKQPEIEIITIIMRVKCEYYQQQTLNKMRESETFFSPYLHESICLNFFLCCYFCFVQFAFCMMTTYSVVCCVLCAMQEKETILFIIFPSYVTLVSSYFRSPIVSTLCVFFTTTKLPIRHLFFSKSAFLF